MCRCSGQICSFICVVICRTGKRGVRTSEIVKVGQTHTSSDDN